ncbi:MAG: methyltransferase domain-containing protein [Candidatus Accumulibacter sp.]|nr:methyltransferase domain-containing protein [Accumulibacter sp.]
MLKKEDILRGLQKIDILAKKAGIVVDISVYGGAALAIAFDIRHATRDVDAIARGEPEFLRKAAADVATEEGWPEDWLNDGVKGFTSANEKMLLMKNFDNPDSGGLRIYTPAPEYLFAMKCMAMRPEGIEGSHDISDIEALADEAGIENAESALALVEAFYPASRIPPKVRFGVEEIMEKVAIRRALAKQLAPDLQAHSNRSETYMNQMLYDYLERPKTCVPDDFWGQVRHTENGKPISGEQLAMIREGLDFKHGDALLDVCCGNGALGKNFFDEVKSYLGVDLSPCLIEIAEKNFVRRPTHTFHCREFKAFCETEEAPARFTKALWYAAFAYFSRPDVAAILRLLCDRFSGIRALFIGAVPDKDKAADFLARREGARLDLDDHTTAIGRWYAQQDLLQLLEECGWHGRIASMPKSFHQSHYRFNVVCTRRDEFAPA